MRLHRAVLPLLIAFTLPATALTVSAAERGLQPEDLVGLDRYSSPVLSSNGRFLVFAKREVDMETGKATSSLWIENLHARDSAPPVRLTPEGWNVNSPAFAPDGSGVFFLSSQSGSSQLHRIGIDGGEPEQLTSYPVDVGGYRIAPDGRQVAFHAEVFPDCGADLDCTKQRLDAREADPASGVVYDRMFVRHWDAWDDGRLNRVFVADLPAGTGDAAEPVLLAPELHANVPSRPFGGSEEYTWSPDGQSVVLSARLATPEEPWSTNFDLYRVPVDGGAAVNLTQDNPAWDTGAVFSPDGGTLYYRAMKRPGFEADRFGIMALDLASGERREVAPDWDRSADSITVSADGETLYVTAQDTGEHPLFAVHAGSGGVTKIIGGGSVGSVQLQGGTLAFTRNSLHSGDQVFVGGIGGAPERAITPSAGEMLPGVRFGEYEQFQFKGWNDGTVHGYVLKPWNYEEGKRYPVAFLIHGGPQGSFGNGWSYRWNPQTYAGQGYAVVMIDFHGSVGYGQEFTDAISQHWGDRPLEDLQKGWRAAQRRYGFLDGANACALGASYGGYMVNWIAGNWHTPSSGAWKCLVNHDGVFDTRMMGFATEELWFTEWENGGTPWQVPENYERFNPVHHVGEWRVPMLVIHGEKDFRIPVSQGLAAFTALQRQGIESKFLYFPDENHWVLQPHNSLLWHRTVNDWLRQHLGQ